MSDPKTIDVHGHFLPPVYLDALRDAMRLLARFYYDTALSVTPVQVNALRELAPLSQILFGTDFPFANEARLRMAEEAFKQLAFTREEEQMVRHRNAASLFTTFHERCCGISR